MVWVPAPHPRVINLGVSKFLQGARALQEPSFSCIWSAKVHARVHASGDEGLDLQAFPGQGMLVVSVATVRSDAPSVPEGGNGQILHGVFGPREDVAPGKLTLSQGFVKLSQLDLGRVRRKRRDKGARGLRRCVRDAKGKAEVVAGSAIPSAVPEAQPAAGDTCGGLPPRVVRQ